MSLNNISTVGFHQSTLGNITSVQNQLFTLTGQISSGKQYSEFSELSQDGNLEKLFSFRSQIDSANSYIESGTLIRNRLSTMDVRIEAIDNIALSFKETIALYKSSSANEIQLADLARNSLQDIQSQLNASLEGRYLFAGGRTDQQPVENLDLISNLQNGNTEVSANYYKGNGNILSINISETTTVEYGITADESAFQKLIGALNMAIAGEEEQNTTLVDNAQNLLDEAMEELKALRVQVGNNTVLIDSNVETHLNLIEELQLFSTQIEDTDLVTATAELATVETILQASYSAFSRASELSLTDYLR